MRTLEWSHGCDPMWSHKGCFHYFGDGTCGHMSDVVMGLSMQGAFQQLSDLVPGAFEGPLLMHGSRATALYQGVAPIVCFPHCSCVFFAGAKRPRTKTWKGLLIWIAVDPGSLTIQLGSAMSSMEAGVGLEEGL